jgi:hypothetical protein
MAKGDETPRTNPAEIENLIQLGHRYLEGVLRKRPGGSIRNRECRALVTGATERTKFG